MKIILAGIVCTSVLSSCELMVEVDIPEYPPKLVVNSLFSPDSVFKITIGATAHIQSQTPPTLADEPIVRLTYEDGTLVELISEGSQEVPGPENELPRPDDKDRPMVWVFRSEARPQPHKTYRINVSAPQHENALAVGVAPMPVKIISAKLDSANVIITEERAHIFPVEITFQDPVGVGDYYFTQMYLTNRRTILFRDDTTVFVDNRRLTLEAMVSSSGVPEFEDGDLVLEDSSFDGSVHTLRRYVTVYPEFFSPIGEIGYYESVHESLRFVLDHSDEEYLKYVRSMELQAQTRGNPLAQPVQVYTNVDGGLGIFAGVTSSTWEFIKR